MSYVPTKIAETIEFPSLVSATTLLHHITREATEELKIGEFKPTHLGQVELYLRWLDRYERHPGEEAPLAIILCAGKKNETVEILDLDRSGIHVAEYLTELPSREVLQERFRRALVAARNRLDKRFDEGN